MPQEKLSNTTLSNAIEYEISARREPIGLEKQNNANLVAPPVIR